MSRQFVCTRMPSLFEFTVLSTLLFVFYPCWDSRPSAVCDIYRNEVRLRYSSVSPSFPKDCFGFRNFSFPLNAKQCVAPSFLCISFYCHKIEGVRGPFNFRNYPHFFLIFENELPNTKYEIINYEFTKFLKTILLY